MNFAQQFPFILKIIDKILIHDAEVFRKQSLAIQTINFLLYLIALFFYFLSGFGLGSAHGPDRQEIVDSYYHGLHVIVAIAAISLATLIAANFLRMKKVTSLIYGFITFLGLVFAIYSTVQFLPFIFFAYFHARLAVSFCSLKLSEIRPNR